MLHELRLQVQLYTVQAKKNACGDLSESIFGAEMLICRLKCWQKFCP